MACPSARSLASPFWFPDSVLLCALLLSAPGRWWIFVLVAPAHSALCLLFPPDVPQWFLLATSAIDSVKGLLGAAILRRLIKNPVRLETVWEFAVFSLFAVLLLPFASAFGGAALRHNLGYAFWPGIGAMVHGRCADSIGRDAGDFLSRNRVSVGYAGADCETRYGRRIADSSD